MGKKRELDFTFYFDVDDPIAKSCNKLRCNNKDITKTINSKNEQCAHSAEEIYVDSAGKATAENPAGSGFCFRGS